MKPLDDYTTSEDTPMTITTTTKLDERLREIAAALNREIAKIVCAMTVDELLALSSVRDDHAVEARAKKTRPAAKGRPKTRRTARPAPKPKPKTRRKTRPAPEAVSTESTVSTPSTEPPPPPPPAPPSPPPEDRAAAFRRSERERLEAAVLKFVSQNPGTDAEIVAVRVGLQKGKAQGLLDDLVLRGRLRMKSGQHGRCYVMVERG